MKTDEKTRKALKGLLEELENLEDALDIMSKDNYDAKVYSYFFTGYNHNEKSSKSVKILMSASLKKAAIFEVENRIAEIKEELEKF